MAHAAHDFYSYNGLAPLSNRTDGHPVYPSRNTYPDRFRYLHNKAELRIQKLQQIALDTLEIGAPGGRHERARDKVFQYAARRQAQADMWLREAQSNYNQHSSRLEKHGSHQLDMKLKNLDRALDNMLLEGNFSWVCIDILYSACPVHVKKLTESLFAKPCMSGWLSEREFFPGARAAELRLRLTEGTAHGRREGWQRSCCAGGGPKLPASKRIYGKIQETA